MQSKKQLVPAVWSRWLTVSWMKALWLMPGREFLWRVSKILTIEARVVAASVETYLKYAEAIGLTATSA